MARQKAIFFDRDGVLNRTNVRNGKAYAPLSLEDFELLPGTGEAVARSQKADFLAIVVTNQPELSTGKLSSESLLGMNNVLIDQLNVDAIYVCPHIDLDGCACRKPLPGMLHQAAQEWDLDLNASYLIGDRWRDIGAGQAVGCTTILIDRPYSGDSNPDFRTEGVLSAVNIILPRKNQ